MVASLALGLVMYAVSRGVPLARITEATGLDQAALMRQDGWVDEDVVPTVWLLLAAHCPGEPVALQLAEHAGPALYGPVGRMCTLASDLRGVLRTFVQNKALLADNLENGLFDRDGESVYWWRHPMDARDGGHAAEAGAAMTVLLLRREFGVHDGVLRVELAHGPLVDEARYREILGVPVRFRAPRHAVVFARGALDRANPHADPDLQLFVQRHLQHLRRTLQAEGGTELMARVRSAVVTNAAHGAFSSEALARRLGMSLRSLQRQLKSEGTTASALIDSARAVHARQLLRDPRLSVEQIAFLLDYSSERSFRRAYERWTGRTPAQARRAG